MDFLLILHYDMFLIFREKTSKKFYFYYVPSSVKCLTDKNFKKGGLEKTLVRIEEYTCNALAVVATKKWKDLFQNDENNLKLIPK